MQGTLTIITTGGVKTETALTLSPDLETLQKAVGGFIEVVPVRSWNNKPAVIFCNEEGKNLGLPVNPHAPLLAGDQIVGDIAIIQGDAEFMAAL